ncbi:glutamine-hydrolyzing carbamoyl-phosphate synthase small subunit [Hazenella sp. IB182353]|uniref:glutamine-hydrolyzing carbamoyl-phosphate synthase small subunit n=1 Tax=Polycladospora coralii TaxID=2771432 RepID=UPI001745DF42|nr:glutamine-hydrolyzing carbamoyl-phosphate synthase small subunit [Polycladospora coralii]MBS7530317.1 glutamine-hydrolyzing carbamoyl-phosphate synthase small subunit [Polycladospora coralii]
MKAHLLLEDGTLFTGESFGSEGEAMGEVVFNTSMTGYQEVLTDPSYANQFITMTYPLIGNYGISRDDHEALMPYAKGLIVREHATNPSNWRNENTISHFLKEHQILGISGIDTRMLTRRIRQNGTMKGIIATGSPTIAELTERLAQPLLTNQVEMVSTKSIHIAPSFGKRVVLVDYGSKYNIQRELVERHCEVITVPYDTSATDILKFKPDGILLSNGPGNPKSVPVSIATIQALLGKVPIFGICLGHQLLALACGADTRKMKFGHRGGNHPVKELRTGRTVITSQNHGYTVDETSLIGTQLEVSHRALNDETVEGLVHQTLPAFSVQYHPESSPGPLDSSYLFDQFIDLMEAFNQKGVAVYAKG